MELQEFCIFLLTTWVTRIVATAVLQSLPRKGQGGTLCLEHSG